MRHLKSRLLAINHNLDIKRKIGISVKGKDRYRDTQLNEPNNQH